MDPMKVVTCACGQQWRGTEAELVPLVQRHGRDVHNMPATAEQVMAMAVDIDPDDEPARRTATSSAPWFAIEGPVQAEVFVLSLAGDRPVLTGPCAPESWNIEVAADEDPFVVVTAAVRQVVGQPLVVHSTSWRRDRGAVVLSFVAVITPDLIGDMASMPVGRAELARGGEASAPTAIATTQVIEHGLRHLAWLVADDPIVAERLAGPWQAALAGYVPEPFRHLTDIVKAVARTPDRRSTGQRVDGRRPWPAGSRPSPGAHP